MTNMFIFCTPESVTTTSSSAWLENYPKSYINSHQFCMIYANLHIFS